MERLYEGLMPITALEKTATAGTTHATKTIPFGDFRRIMFYVLFEAADGNLSINHDTEEKMKLTLIERKGLTGATNDLVEDIDVKAGEGVLKMEAESVNDWTNDSALTIDGVTFTKKASKDDAENEFTTGAELEAQIEAALSYIDADDTTNDVTIKVDDPKDAMTVTLSMEGTTDLHRLSINECAVLVEAHVAELTKEYNSVHLNISGNDAGTVNSTVFAVLGNPYAKPVKQPAHIGVEVPA